MTTSKIESTFTDYRSDQLPKVVVGYLDAHDEQHYAAAAAHFAPDATVLDNGNTHEGIAAIRGWIQDSATEYTYTSTRIGQQIADEKHANVRIRLDGSFPGGTVTLHYQFELAGDTIRRLAIEV